MRGDDLLLYGSVLLASLVPLWPARWIAGRLHRPAPAALATFLSNLAMAVALAAAFGFVLDLVRGPYYRPPPPGNFTLPLPWMIVLPIVQLWTFGPVMSLVAAVLTWRRKRASPAYQENR